jgi:uncharacterized membrane protein
MYFFILTLRIIHIVGGVFWVGSLLFLTFYIFPAVVRSGPDGGKMMQAITGTNKFAQVMALAALLTILSGILLMWKLSGGFSPEWFGTNYGISLSTGGTFAVIAFIQGMIINRPGVMRIEKIAHAAASRGGAPTEAERTEMMQIRTRVILSTQWIAFWLTITLITMAIARYV